MNKIITWNLQHGGGSRIDRIVDVLKQHQNATTFVLTEFKNNTFGTFIQKALSDIGFINQYTTKGGEKENSVLIASTEYFKYKLFPELNNHSQRVIKVYNNNFSVYGCYFPQANEKKHVFDFLLKEIENNPNEKIIITGDINTGKHYLDEHGATFFHTDYLVKIENNNFFDAWRYFHKDKREFSWYSNAGNGFRLDHFFIHHDLQHLLKGCNYIHTYREDKISDHSMMQLEIDA